MSLIPATQVNVNNDTDYRKKYILGLLQNGSSTAPVRSPLEAIARALQGGVGGYFAGQLKQEQDQQEADSNAAYLKVIQALGGQSAPSGSPAPTVALPPVQRTVAGTLASGVEPKSITGPREGGPVMPSPKVWGDKEAEAAGLYEPAKVAALAPTAPIPSPAAADLSAPTPVRTESIAPTPTPSAPQMADARQRLVEAMLQPGAGRASQMAGRALGDMLVTQAMKPTEWDFKDVGGGRVIAINKHNPGDVREVQNNAQGLVNFEGAKTAAVEAAKRQGAPEFEAAKEYATKTAGLKAAKEFAAPEQAKQAAASGDIVTTDIDRAMKLIDNKGGVLPTTGGLGKAISHIGGTSAGDLGELLTGIKANVGFAELQKMRAASPTGGALGQVTEQEHKLLSSVRGSVEQSQSADQLKYNLKRLKNTTLDIVHGAGNGPPREILTPPKVSSIAEARKYPSGTQIILPDGSPGVVP